MRSVIDRAAASNAFAQRLSLEPLAVAGSDGYRLRPDDVTRDLRLGGDATDVADALGERLRRLAVDKWA
jgi:hypothetical protein